MVVTETQMRIRMDTRMWLAVKVLLMVTAILLVVTIGQAFQSHQQQRENDQIAAQVAHLEDFVNELEEETPTEREQNAAVTKAVQEVPIIKGILCEVFPQATACQEG